MKPQIISTLQRLIPGLIRRGRRQRNAGRGVRRASSLAALSDLARSPLAQINRFLPMTSVSRAIAELGIIKKSTWRPLIGSEGSDAIQNVGFQQYIKWIDKDINMATR
uniref:Capsid protein n=1 Tax=Steinernema glaseri TaxID=37863 RepID=A0A1I7XW30_9BILA